MKASSWMAALALMSIGAASVAAKAAEVRVISGGAAKSFVQPLAESFKSESGHAVRLDWQPMGTLVKSLAGGQPADMVIVTSEVLDQLDRHRCWNAWASWSR